MRVVCKRGSQKSRLMRPLGVLFSSLLIKQADKAIGFVRLCVLRPHQSKQTLTSSLWCAS